ncbi:MAG: hypothetical protein ACTSRZ_01370 [Promethearchaeota archaeon]
MAKDKIIGALITIVGLGILILYTIMGPIDRACTTGAFLDGSWLDSATSWRNIFGLDWEWMVVIPVWLIVAIICIIAIWIGISMLTTPPPVPLEELEEELEAEEAGSE